MQISCKKDQFLAVNSKLPAKKSDSIQKYVKKPYSYKFYKQPTRLNNKAKNYRQLIYVR